MIQPEESGKLLPSSTDPEMTVPYINWLLGLNTEI